MSFFGSDNKLKGGELLGLDSIFLNIHLFVKVKFELLSRVLQEIKNPCEGEMIGYHYLIKNKDMAHLNCNKYRIENEDDHDRFEETFMERGNVPGREVGYSLPKNVRSYPTNFIFIRGMHKKKQDRGYSDTGGFIFKIEYMFGRDGDLFSDKFKEDLKKISIKLIKSTIK